MPKTRRSAPAAEEVNLVADQYDGVDISKEGDTLVIRVDTTFEGRPSASGKSRTIATTHGLHNISAKEFISLTVGRKG